MSQANERAKLHVPERWLPIPTTISAEAQASLASPFSVKMPNEPDPADKEAWREFIAERDTEMNAGVAQAAAHYPCEIKEHSWKGVAVHEVVPPHAAPDFDYNAIFYLHGGGFTLGGGIAGAQQAFGLAALSGIRVFSVDYRMPPDHPFPAGLNDCVEAYTGLLERYQSSEIAIYGPSAGAGMAGSLILNARDRNLPLPSSCVLSSPEIDLTESGDSFEVNNGIDRIMIRLTNSIALYADGHDLRDPYLSPLFGDFGRGFPPTILTTGTRDLFLSNAVLMHRELRRAKIDAELHVWEARSHGGFFGAPEDIEVWEEEIRFIKKYLRPGASVA